MATAPTLADFGQLLQAARHQGEPQRLLFVFALRDIDEKATGTQRDAFAAGAGGYLQPCVCVDKAPADVASFAALAAESERTGQDWDVVFVASLAGRDGTAPDGDQVDAALRSMVNAIIQGRVTQWAAFDRAGDPIRFV